MICKKIFDARTLPRKAKEQLRIAAVRRVEAGESPENVATGIGINRRQMYRWIEAFHYGGEDALRAKPIKGATPKLNANQMAKLSRMVREKNPLQLKFDYALCESTETRVKGIFRQNGSREPNRLWISCPREFINNGPTRIS